MVANRKVFNSCPSAYKRTERCSVCALKVFRFLGVMQDHWNYQEQNNRLAVFTATIEYLFQSWKT